MCAYDPDAERIGLQAAEAIGVEPQWNEGGIQLFPDWCL
jgi:hypothetical protein